MTRIINQNYSQISNAVFQLIRGLLIAFPLKMGIGHASEKLDMSFIQGGSQLSKDAWAVLNENYAPGRYFVDVSLNGKEMGKQFLDVTSQDTNELCLSKAWLEKSNINIRPDYFKSGYDAARQCYVLSKSPSTEVDFDVSTQSFALRIPQQGLAKKTENVEWDYGTSAFRMNYNANANSGRDNTTEFGSADLKANLGHWVVSSTATASVGNGERDTSVDMFTATRAIRSLSADLAVGKTQAGDNLLGSSGTYGISLTRNNSMKPGDIGYSPVFSGIASGPARVTLMQGERVLYSEMVPTGPFSITDVPLYNSGDVTMKITEENGREHVQIFPLTVIAGQLSPGQYEFNLAVGIPDNDSKLKDGIFSVSYGYGFQGLSLRAGEVWNKNYQGTSAGIVTGLGALGAVSAEGAHAIAKYRIGTESQGNKVRLSWNKQLATTATGLRIGWSTQSKRFEDLSSFAPKELWQRKRKGRQVRNEWNLGVSQPVNGVFSLSVSGWQRSYYNYNGKDSGITGTLSTQIKNVSLNIGISGAKNTYGDNNWTFSASVSVPFVLFDRHYSSSSSMSSSKNGGGGVSSGISGSLNDRFSYGLGGGHDSDGRTSSYFNASYNGDKAYASGTLNHSSSNGTSGSVSFNGSVLAVPAAHSVIFSKASSDTVAVVNVKDTPRVQVTSGEGETDSNGNLVIPLNSYDWNTVTVDASSLPLNMELTGTSRRVVPTSQAVIWMPFEPVKVQRYLLQVKQKNGEFVPGGTWAYDDHKIPLGFVANDGVLMINAVDTLGNITLGQCQIPATRLEETEKLQEITCD